MSASICSPLAFICSPLHINTIVAWADEHQALPYGMSAQDFAALLYSENVRSVNYRYSERTKRTGFVYDRSNITYVTPIQIIKLCHCLDYQSCEHPQWERSKAKRSLQAIIDAAAMRLPGYNDVACRWSI